MLGKGDTRPNEIREIDFDCTMEGWYSAGSSHISPSSLCNFGKQFLEHSSHYSDLNFEEPMQSLSKISLNTDLSFFSEVSSQLNGSSFLHFLFPFSSMNLPVIEPICINPETEQLSNCSRNRSSSLGFFCTHYPLTL